MIRLTVAALLPEITDAHGDAQNATVLQRRAAWGGVDVSVLPIRTLDDLPGTPPDVVILGSAAESAVPDLLGKLTPLASSLRTWLEAGTGLLAIGTGWHVLTEQIEVVPGRVLDGLGVLPGRALWEVDRVSDDLVIDTPFGRLVGFENHRRSVELPLGAQALGLVVRGEGNRRDSGAEGVQAGTAIGTHLHGPLLAKNPGLADHFLEMAVNRHRGDRFAVLGDIATQADELAAATRDRVLARLGLLAR